MNDAWRHAGGDVAAVVLELVNFYLHFISGSASTRGAGPWLSAIFVLMLLFTGWKRWEIVY